MNLHNRLELQQLDEMIADPVSWFTFGPVASSILFFCCL
jgi:hypothetical protein